MQINSPFASLPGQMYSPGMTASSIGQQQNRLGQQYNVQTTLKNQSAPRGGAPSLFAALQGQSARDASSRLAPIGQRFADEQANAGWQRQVQNANESYGTGMLGRSLGNQLYNQSPAIPLAMANNQLSRYGDAQFMLGSLFGGQY